MISTKELKEKASRMEDSPAKQMILRFPDEINRQDLLLKFDLILPFLGTEKKQEIMK